MIDLKLFILLHIMFVVRHDNNVSVISLAILCLELVYIIKSQGINDFRTYS